jgi:hypothetical protein
MKKEALKRIFDFLEEKGEQNVPFLWKHKNNIPFTEEELNVKGNLDFFETKITSLPEGLKVGGDLDLANSDITSLPEGLKVGGDLDLRLTEIALLPEGLEVGGDLYIWETPLEKYTDDELRKMVKPGFIKGKIYIRI